MEIGNLVGSGGGIGNRQFLEPERRIPHKIISEGGGKRVTTRHFFF